MVVVLTSSPKLYLDVALQGEECCYRALLCARVWMYVVCMCVDVRVPVVCMRGYALVRVLLVPVRGAFVFDSRGA